eukprot:m.949189 g.949189  ORF g.949189 m.949189 type:complete len:55 (-) comp315240_c0_seq1:28-192(-)
MSSAARQWTGRSLQSTLGSLGHSPAGHTVMFWKVSTPSQVAHGVEGSEAVSAVP